jgi:hypothetical protein
VAVGDLFHLFRDSFLYATEGRCCQRDSSFVIFKPLR